jgi:hypothetical protein
MSKKSWDRFRGDTRRAPVGTLGGATYPVAGATTLGGCVEFWAVGLTCF